MRVALLYDDTVIGVMEGPPPRAEEGPQPRAEAEPPIVEGRVVLLPAYAAVRSPFQRYSPYCSFMRIVDRAELDAREADYLAHVRHLRLQGPDGEAMPTRILDFDDGSESDFGPGMLKAPYLYAELQPPDDGSASVGARRHPPVRQLGEENDARRIE